MGPRIDRLFAKPAAVLLLFGASVLFGWHGFDLGWDALCGRRPHLAVSVNLRTTQYFYNYQDLGFIKRGLVGTLLHPFPLLLTRTGLAAVAAFLVLAFAFVFWRFFITSTAAVANSGRGVLAIICALMPAFLLRLGFDFGRFDVVDLLAAVVCLVCLDRSRWLLASLPAALAVLVHEDFLVLELPLLAAVAYGLLADQPRRRAAAALTQLLVPPAVAGIAVMLWGRSRLGPDELAQYFAHNPVFLAATSDGQVNFNEVTVLTRTLWDNVVMNGRMFVEKRALLHLPIILLWFGFAVRYAVNFYTRNGLARDLSFYAAFAPLLLGVVGFDYYRWVALAAVNLLIMILWQCRQLAQTGAGARIDFSWSAKILVLSAVLGPIDNTKSFPFLFLLLDKISPWRFAW